PRHRPTSTTERSSSASNTTRTTGTTGPRSRRQALPPRRTATQGRASATGLRTARDTEAVAGRRQQTDAYYLLVVRSRFQAEARGARLVRAACEVCGCGSTATILRG